MSEERNLDGNAAAGLLEEIFPFEATMMQTVCAACGAMNRVAELTVYTDAPGLVVRCLGCSNVVIRVVHGGHRYWLDLHGTTCLQIEESG